MYRGLCKTWREDGKKHGRENTKTTADKGPQGAGTANQSTEKMENRQGQEPRHARENQTEARCENLRKQPDRKGRPKGGRQGRPPEEKQPIQTFS